VNFSATHQATNNTYESALTEPPLFDLFGRQGEHGKKLDYYFDSDLDQHRSWRNHRIDLQTLEEIPQEVEELEKRIVARCNPTGSLACLLSQGNSLESVLKGHTARRVSMAANNAFVGGKGI
jgi:hypothetical protein